MQKDMNTWKYFKFCGKNNEVEKNKLCQIKAITICQSRKYAYTQMLITLGVQSTFFFHIKQGTSVLSFSRSTRPQLLTHIFQLTTTASGSNLSTVPVRRQRILLWSESLIHTIRLHNSQASAVLPKSAMRQETDSVALYYRVEVD